jgi:hypothetical protein
MTAQLPKLAILTLAAIFALGVIDASAAKKKRVKRPPAPDITRSETPIIMRGYPNFNVPDIMREEKGAPPRRAERPAGRPRGSSTYIPPPVPSPNAPSSPPPAVLLQPPRPAASPPAARNTFQDRVINCIHSAPLNAGIGNNPMDQQAYIRQCAN